MKRPLGMTWTLALLAFAWQLSSSAESRCDELGLTICREVRISSFTGAGATWSDGSFTSINAPDGVFQVFPGNGGVEEGYKTSLYSNAGLQSQLMLYQGSGPVFLVSYRIDPSFGSSADYLNGGRYVGQASSAFLHGKTTPDPALKVYGESSANFGVNRAQTSLSGSVIAPYTLDANNVLKPGLTADVQPSDGTSAVSAWHDTAQLNGGGGPASFNVLLDGSLTKNSFMYYSLSAKDSQGKVQNILGHFLFGDQQAGPVSLNLTGTLQVTPGMQYTLSSELAVFTTLSGSAIPLTGGTVTAEASFYNTAKVTSIVVPAGTSLSFGSGAAYWTDKVHEATAVAEPSVWSLMVVGLLALGLMRRGRQSKVLAWTRGSAS